MLTFKRFLTEQVVIGPVTRNRPKMAPGGIDRARNMLASALNNTDRGVKRLMAVEDGQVIGAISYYPHKKRWVIDRMGSLKKGTGTALLKQVIDAARAAKAERIELWATDTSDSFYGPFGFKDTGDETTGKGHKVLLLQPES